MESRFMSKPIDQVEAEALELSVQDRARLARRLLESLDDQVDDPEEVDRAWKAEIERRVADLDSGKVDLIPGDEVLREARKILGKK